ncbi:acetyl/propionyl/methylcrotonyl-CoA carboxylase subunit alpha [Brevundimonas lutea]|uniref:acetyl/propionyl/methylcrotonyl-CoA carboxylase subunit alpha n=1 Tax=Brevundimonas lutea TaxID=2293980 RepID=UPI000F037BC3|nr:acetyl/propionyl/methylcrotonyl-CoA carboxylase subunit alpha [Brevundimonas lutea]
MFTSVLVANRGEIACRVFRTAKRMGLRTIAVHSEADASALHVKEADEAVLIGPAPARESYLDTAKVLAAAKQTGAEAIHPGYGFLSENAEFAEAVMAAGLVWIGPPPAAIRAMGLKDAAKDLMEKAGVPVTPGYLGADQSVETLTAEAARIGYPVLIKAVAGGGGKGMKRVDAAEDFVAGLDSAKREAKAAFGDDRVLIETYITRPRHIEVQVFGDGQGNVVHLFERDCSLQRRHQKVIEEAPAPGMDDVTREAVTSAAVRAAQAVNYVGAGTVEFIADASEGLKPDRVWFMEMNTRLQVEHPVTEAVTGVDLVEWQLRVAAGEPLPMKQADIRLNGWAMEARLYAEDPSNGFLPSIGRLEHFVLPEPGDGVRIDAGVEAGGEVSQFYDPMIAKLIVHAATREEAAEGLAEAVEAVEVWPVRTNAGFLGRCLRNSRFRSGDVDTALIAAEGETLSARPDDKVLDAIAVALTAEDRWYDRDGRRNHDWGSPWAGSPGGTFGLRLSRSPRSQYAARLGGRTVVGSVMPALDGDRVWTVGEGETALSVEIDGQSARAGERVVAWTYGDGDDDVLFDRGEAVAFGWRGGVASRGAGGGVADGSLRAPMPGRIAAAPVKDGEAVKAGQTLVVLEAMKMEHALTAPFDGVAQVRVAVGDQVTDGAELALVEAVDG